MPAQRAEFRPARSRSTSSVVVVDEPDADRLILAAEPQIQVERVPRVVVRPHPDIECRQVADDLSGANAGDVDQKRRYPAGQDGSP